MILDFILTILEAIGLSDALNKPMDRLMRKFGIPTSESKRIPQPIRVIGDIFGVGVLILAAIALIGWIASKST
jgi:hypothetical protein